MFNFEKNDVLFIVDPNTDFFPGGKLEVKNADKIIDPINGLIEMAEGTEGVILGLSLDYHPKDHMSFAEYGGNFPEHCVIGTDGQLPNKNLNLENFDIVVLKGENKDIEEYSAFKNSFLDENLSRLGFDKNKNKFVISGLVLEICLLSTIQDAYDLGYDIYFDPKTTMPIDRQGWNETINYLMTNRIVTFI